MWAKYIHLDVSYHQVEDYEFFANATEGYARSLDELTLQQLMRKVVRLLEEKIAKNTKKLESTYDETLLQVGHIVRISCTSYCAKS
jgi:UDP-N-acetylglucosamine:LPS N-acetylglucosamine transferase